MLTAEVSVSTTNNIGPKARRGVIEFLKTGADRGAAEARERVPVDRGELLRNIFDPEVDGDRVVWGVRDVDYAEAMEFGTGPFAPPLRPILDWAERVTGDRGFGYYVHHKIKTEGIDAQPYARPARKEQINWYRKNDAGEYIEREFR